MKISLESKVLCLESKECARPLDARQKTQDRRRKNAFTILEVMIACTIFFLVAFAVLGIVTQGLAAARALQQREPDCGMLAAMATLNNQLLEGGGSGDFEDMFPGQYKGYTWMAETNEVGSNGLFRIDFAIIKESGRKGASETHTSILLFRPGSPPGAASKGGL